LKRNLPKLGFIGAGKVATSLACALHGKGYPVVAIASRSLSSAQKLAACIPCCQPYADKQEVVEHSDIVFITTPDDVISQVTGELSWRQGKSVVHCSGADSTVPLKKAVAEGAAAGVLHPLQTFAGIEQAKNSLAGITFCIESEDPLLSILKCMAVALGGRWIVINPEDRTLYHASAVIVSNYLVALVKMAIDLWSSCGLSQEDAVRALTPLIKGTLNNIETLGLPDCLTGPISRGDIGTLKKHLSMLNPNHNEIIPAYCELGMQTVPVALSKGRIDAARAEEIKALLKSYVPEGVKP
jgi:predicted short-subunit dehydrogenase-like oxidoreductase (DUF2520 family)